MKNIIAAAILSLGFGTASFAQSNASTCKVDAINYMKSGWRHDIDTAKVVQNLDSLSSDLDSILSNWLDHAHMASAEVELGTALEIEYRSEKFKELRVRIRCTNS